MLWRCTGNLVQLLMLRGSEVLEHSTVPLWKVLSWVLLQQDPVYLECSSVPTCVLPLLRMQRSFFLVNSGSFCWPPPPPQSRESLSISVSLCSGSTDKPEKAQPSIAISFSLVSWGMCLYVHVHICSCVWGYMSPSMCMYISMEASGPHQVSFLSVIIIFLFDTGSLTCLELTK